MSVDKAAEPALPLEEPALPRGTRLGPFEIECVLGSGGMGAVYRARVREPVLDLPVEAVTALKVIHTYWRGEPAYEARFRREAEIGSQVRHPNVVRTFGAITVTRDAGDLPVLVMEYVEGKTLHRLLKELERVPEALCRHIGREVAMGLSALHAHQAIHRDIKPENVLITESHVVKVMDLGVARVFSTDLDDPARRRLTGTMEFVGSLHYAAPEQLNDLGVPVDHRADLYALGLVLYELATGEHPFADLAPAVRLQRQLTETPRPLHEVRPSVSPFFSEVVGRLLQAQRDRRFRDAAELAAVLEKQERSTWWAEQAPRIQTQAHRAGPVRRVPRESALHGRERELALLRDAYAKARTGSGQVVLIEGEAGIGKSRLWEEALDALEASGERFHTLVGRYPPGGAATAYAAFGEAFREHFGEQGLEQCLQPHLAPMPLLIPAFAALLRDGSRPPGAEPLSRESLQTAFVRTTRSLAAERPTVLVIEDLHFTLPQGQPQSALPEGLSLFAALAHAVPGYPILLVGTTRPVLSATWLAELESLPQWGRIALKRLGARDLASLLVDALKSEALAEEIGFRVSAKSDGNPWFVFETLRMLQDEGALARGKDGRWERVGELGELAIPATIAGMIEARMTALGSADRNLLDVAACCGYEFDPNLAGEVLELKRMEVLQRLASLEKTTALVRSVNRRFTFDHHQVQEALYAAMPDLLREEYHGRIGDLLARRLSLESSRSGDDFVRVCDHLLRGQRGAEALPYLQPALDYLERGRVGEHELALSLMDRALLAPGLLTDEARVRLLLRKVDRLVTLSRAAQERGVIEEALEAAEGLQADHPARTALLRAAHLARGWHQHRTGRPASARADLEQALVSARSVGEQSDEARALGYLGIVAQAEGRHGEAREHLDACLAAFEALGDQDGQARALGAIGNLLQAAGDFVGAGERHSRVLKIFESAGARRLQAVAHGNVGTSAYARGLFATARQHFERSLSLARELGYRLGEATALVNLGPLHAVLGRAEAGRECLESARRLFREVGSPEEALAVQQLGAVALLSGDLRTSKERLEEAVALMARTGVSPLRQAHARAILGGVCRAQGDAATAREHLAAALALPALPAATRTLALAQQALLTNREAEPALEAYRREAPRLSALERLENLHLLAQGLRSAPLRAEARALLAELLSHAPLEAQAAMTRNVSLFREVQASTSERSGVSDLRGDADAGTAPTPRST